MEQFAHTLLQLLRRHYAPLQPGYPADKPRYESIGLKLAPEDDSEEAKSLLRACQDFMSYNRGHARALREKALPQYQRDTLSAQVRWIYENLIQLQATRKAPTTPWIQELLTLEASLDERLYYRLLSQNLYLFCANKTRELNASSKGGFHLMTGLTLTHSGILLTNYLKEEPGLKYQDTFLLESLHSKLPETIADEIEGLSQAIKLGRRHLRELAKKYEQGEIFTPRMRETRDYRSAQNIANRLASSLSRSERALLKSHLHLLTELL